MDKKDSVLSSWEFFKTFIDNTLRDKVTSLSDGYDFNYLNVRLVNSSRYLVTYQNNYDVDDYINLNTENEALLQIFRRVFSIFEAGKDKKNIFDIIYAFPENSDKYSHLLGVNILNTDDLLLPVNLSPEYVSFFLRCLCGRAIAIKNSTDNLDSANRSRFFLIGDVGVGKTTFLNYLFSHDYDYFDSAKVIWVRVDLTKDYLSNKTLHEAVRYQLARIYREYYEKDIDHNFVDFLERELSPLIKAGRIKDTEAKSKIDEYLAPFIKERNTSFDPCLEEGVKKYVEHNYAMIYVIDGLDKLRDEDDFKKKIIELKEYILSSEKTKHLYLFVMRTSSHAELMNKYLLPHEKHSLSGLRDSAKTFFIEPPKLQEIIEKRLVLFSMIWDTVLEEIKDDVIIDKSFSRKRDIDDINNKLLDLKKTCKWITPEAIKDYYDIFLRFLYRGLLGFESDVKLNSWNNTETYSSLKNVVGVNFRMLLRALQDLQRCFLQTLQSSYLHPEHVINIRNLISNNFLHDDFKAILKKHYRVIPVLLRRKPRYIHPYRYVYSSDGNLCLRAKSGSDSQPYLFNIFMGANAIDKDCETYHLLAKVRILQYLSMYDDKENDEMLSTLVDMFGYDRSNLIIDLEELKYMNLINTTPHELPNGYISYSFTISRTGGYILNNFLKEYNYLRIILDETIVPQRTARLFKIVEKNVSENDIVLWNIQLIPKVIHFLSLIKYVEDQERTNFLKKYTEEEFSEWRIYPRIADVLETIPRIIRDEHRLWNQAYDMIRAI
jgi:hypothetical protein